MAQSLRALAALPEDLGSIPTTYTVAYNSNSSLEGSKAFFWTMSALHTWDALQAKHLYT